MFAIDCPWCGARDQQEFHCGGEDRGPRPPRPEAMSDAAWSDHVFTRANPKGPHHELWHHRHGCRRWFTVLRDTASDRILAVHAIGETPRAAAGTETDHGRPAETNAAVASDRPLRERKG